MSEKHSIVIEEYLLLLYQLRGAGERLKAVTLAQRLKSSAPTVHATLQRMPVSYTHLTLPTIYPV